VNSLSHVDAFSMPSPSAHSRTDRRATRTRAGDAADVCEVRCIDAAAVMRVRAAHPPGRALSATAERLRALGNPTRLRLLLALALADEAPRPDGSHAGELCVCDLALLLGAGSSVVSHSLRALRQLGLVRFRKAGKIAYYRVADAATARGVLALVGQASPPARAAVAPARAAAALLGGANR
jgi:ArsR family transcriptional regulator, lead/cadmium/zinc/bismuth-responsive transcriptional repressor